MASEWSEDFESLFAMEETAAYNLTDVDLFENSSLLTNGTTGRVKWNPPYWVLLGIGLYLTIVGTLATFGNLLFIVTTMRWRLMRNNAHMILLLNMALCDFAISIVGYPYTTISGYLGYWPFGDLMCTLYAFLCFLLSQVTMNTLVAVSIFRYIAICKPHCQHLLNQRSSWIALLLCWIHALFWTVPPLIGWSSYTFEPTGVSCSLNWYDKSTSGLAYTIGCTLSCYVLHVSILVWCYRKIFTKTTKLASSKNWRRRQRENAEKEVASPSPVTRCESVVVFSFITENLSPLEIHVLRMNVIMVVTFLVCWTPYAVVSFATLVIEDMSPFWYVFPTMFAKTSCMMNPIVYGLTNRFLRRELLRVLRQCCGLTTPIEEFQLMRQRQQEGLYNKEGVYTGGRNICMCTCDRCVAARRKVAEVQAKALCQVRLHNSPRIDLFVRQQREKEAEDARRNKQEHGLSPFTLPNQRPNSLGFSGHSSNSQVGLVRSTSLNIQLASSHHELSPQDYDDNPSPTGTETEDIHMPNELGQCDMDHDHLHENHIEIPHNNNPKQPELHEVAAEDGPLTIAKPHSLSGTAV